MNYEKLDEREKSNAKNLKGLINYAKKLTRELDEQREPVFDIMQQCSGILGTIIEQYMG